MLQEKVSAALRWVTNKAGGLLEPTPETIKLLESKHPDPQPEESFLVSSLLSKVGLEKVDNVIFENIQILKQSRRQQRTPMDQLAPLATYPLL